MHLNIQGGILKKLHELHIFLESSNVDIICLNEHWLGDDQIVTLSSFEKYNVAAYYCRKSVEKGGSCILIKHEYNYKERTDFYIYNEDDVFEMCSIEIVSLKTIVISIYRTPYDNNFKIFINKLELLLIKLLKYTKTHQVYIAADFNIDILQNAKSPTHRNIFLNLIAMYGFEVNFGSPTRLTKNTTTCIDNIISNNIFKNNKQKSKMNLELGLSDHRGLFIELFTDKICKTSFNAKTNFKKRLYSTKNTSLFYESISEIDDWELSLLNDAQTNFNTFFHQFMTIFDFSFPLKFYSKKTSKNKNKSWVTKGIKISSERKRELSRIAKTNSDINFQNYYKNYRKIFKAVCDRARKMYNCDIISNSDNRSKAVWTVVKSELGILNRKSRDFPDLCVGDKPLKEGQLIADFFNDQFANVSKVIKCQPCPYTATELVKKVNINIQDNFKFKHVTIDQVKKTILSLKNKKSVGWDEIPVEIVKKTAGSISIPLCYLINQCFDEGIYPCQLKNAELKPLFKKGSVEDPGNYRPVSILPTLSKIFEKIAYDQIYSFFENNGIFTDQQFGFRSGRSTTTAVSNFINWVSGGLDGSQSTAAVFCDLSKAFDCVNHDILINKLKHYKFSKSALSWVNSYLRNRQQRTILKKNDTQFISEWQKIECGVPQGSILGPLFFLIFVNDVTKSVSSNLILYADDTTAVVQAENSEVLKTKLELTVLELSSWFGTNGLKLNSSKTQILKFQTVQNRQKLTIELYYDGNILSFIDNTKFLGINIDQNLTWKPHIEMTIKKLNTACFQMCVLRNVTDLKTKLMIYYAMFYSVLQYGIELWGSVSHASDIFKLQKKYLRLMAFVPKRTSCKPLFKRFEILTMPCIYIFRMLIFLKNNPQSYSDNQFVHDYPTRFKNDFQYPRHRLSLYEKSPYYMGLRLFNSLPASLKAIDDVKTFKNSLKMYLLEKNYYSVQDYLVDNVH